MRSLRTLLVLTGCLLVTVSHASREPKHAAAKGRLADVDSSIRVGVCAPLPGPAPDRPPALLSPVGLNYPNTALDAPRDDSARVCVLVDSTGAVAEATLSHAVADLSEAALASARWWVFEPARRNGRPVPSRLEV